MSKYLTALILLVFACGAAALSAQALSGTYTIANGNPGSAYNFGDLGAAFDALEANGVAGPVVLELYDVGGAFTSSASYQLGSNLTTLKPVAGISATNSITIRAAAGNSPLISGSGAGNRYSPSFFGTLSFDEVSYVTIEGLEITGGVTYGILWFGDASTTITPADHINIRRCGIHGISAGGAIMFYSPNAFGINQTVTIENNMCWDCFGYGGSSAFFGRMKGVIGCVRHGWNWRVRHNTVVHTSNDANSGAYYSTQGGTSRWEEFSYNVTYFDSTVAAAYFRLESSNSSYLPYVADRNVVYLLGQAVMSDIPMWNTWSTWQGVGKDPNGLFTNPMLAGTGPPFNLDLLPGSPAIDLAIGSPLTADIYGNARPFGAAPDAGAHEAPYLPSDVQVELVLPSGSYPVYDGTSIALGNVELNGDSFTFDVLSNGAGSLHLYGSPPVQPMPVTNCGAGTAALTQPSSPIAPTTKTSFTVFVQPAGLGPMSFTISIANSDTAKNPYNFTVTGNGIPNNAPAVAAPAAGSAFTGAGPFTLAVDPGATLANASIELTDINLDPITVASIVPNGSAPIGITPPALPPAPAHPVVLTWTGTADAANPPQAYSWTVTFSDAGTGLPVAAIVTIEVNDLPPTHAIAGAGSGNGSAGSPYTTAYIEGNGPGLVVDLASVSDANLGQTVVLAGSVPGAGNPAGVGFAFTVGTHLSVAPAGTLLAADAGTHTYTVQISDGSNVVDVHVAITVTALPPPVVISTTTLSDGVVGVAYAQAIQASGGVGAITLSITAGVLPPGLVLNANPGAITGTSTAAVTETFTIQAQDSIGQTDSKQYTLTIKPAPKPPDTGTDGGSGGSDGGCVTAGVGAGSGLLPVALLLALAGLAVALRRRGLAYRWSINSC